MVAYINVDGSHNSNSVYSNIRRWKQAEEDRDEDGRVLLVTSIVSQT